MPAQRINMRKLKDALRLKSKRSGNPSFINGAKLRLSRHRKLTHREIEEWIENELRPALRTSGRTKPLA